MRSNKEAHSGVFFTVNGSCSVLQYMYIDTASACPTRVTKVLSKMFHSPLEAEKSIAIPLGPLRAEILHLPANGISHTHTHTHTLHTCSISLFFVS